jgi:hypothetical protein
MHRWIYGPEVVKASGERADAQATQSLPLRATASEMAGASPAIALATQMSI